MQEKQTVKLEHTADLLIKAGPPSVLKISFSLYNRQSCRIIQLYRNHLPNANYLWCYGSKVFVAGYYSPYYLFFFLTLYDLP